MVAVGIKITYVAWPREEKFDTKIAEDDSALIFTKKCWEKYQILFSTAVVEKLFTIPSVSV